ncbi:hypothetical protein ACMDCR_15530 [Labrys okinawensis]|uniref:hypothetical protein n=1 Tax=Labrys okinawensis TaxID=346911 RepID=UPI0039BC5150
MKVFAIASIPAGVTTPDVRKHLPSEVPATLKLYLDGKIEQFWFRENAGPIFLLNVSSVDEAKSILNTLPLVEEKLMSYEYLPVTPLSPLGLLIQDK